MRVCDFNVKMAEQICEAINRGNEVHIKRERDKVVIIEVKRKCLSKNDISTGY